MILPNHLGSGGITNLSATFAAGVGDTVVDLPVPCTTLDRYLHGNGGVDFIKIDAEGAELLIFAGMAQTTIRRILFEFSPAMFPDPRGFLSGLSQRGFAMQHVRRDGSAVPADINALMAATSSEIYLSLG